VERGTELFSGDAVALRVGGGPASPLCSPPMVGPLTSSTSTFSFRTYPTAQMAAGKSPVKSQTKESHLASTHDQRTHNMQSLCTVLDVKAPIKGNSQHVSNEQARTSSEGPTIMGICDPLGG
jgi:hypothetical protein